MSRLRREARRDFLKRLTATLAGGSAMSLLPQLRLMEAALAQEGAGGSYRALVCVYLGGGNDSFNWLVPTDAARYGVYSTSRGGTYTGANGPLGIAQGSLLPLTMQGLPGGHSYGLHPACADWDGIDRNGSVTAMPGLASLTSQGRVAWVANMGTLIEPVTKATFNDPSVAKPPQLYSHNDQTKLWHQGQATANFRLGWGGQVADRVFGLNGAIAGGSKLLPMNISFSGSQRFMVGNQVLPYQMNSCGNPNNGDQVPGLTVGSSFANCSGTTSLSGFDACGSGSDTQQQEIALCTLLNSPGSHLFQIEHAETMKRAMDLSAAIRSEISGASTANPSLLTTPFRALADDQAVPGYNQIADGGNSLAEQLAMVARLIRVRQALGHQRSIFFVSLGGFDTHATQMPDTGQPRLLRRVSRALGSFYRALEEMGLQDNVTTFTMSEFARTLNSNGDGSDHGWGGVQMVMGGSVRGGRLFGTFPDQTLNGPDCFNRGQMIPTTAMDQYAGALAQWMGLGSSDLATIFPNLGNFTPQTLDILNPAPV
ncbi:MAG: DUF1501 domain-containing protein [Lysobacterales bacterium]